MPQNPISIEQDDSDPHSAKHPESDWAAHLTTLRQLVDVVHESSLSELEVEQNGVRLSLKARSVAASHSIAGEQTDSAEEPVTKGALSPTLTGSKPAPADDPGLVDVVAPMIGTFYRAASPSDPNFVEIGDHVELGQPLALIEIMKVFNEITSEVEGTIAGIKAGDKAEVQTGDVLMSIRVA